jgi:hypothetical protein
MRTCRGTVDAAARGVGGKGDGNLACVSISTDEISGAELVKPVYKIKLGSSELRK